MSKRKIDFATGETYHLFNRGVEKRNIFINQDDSGRFFDCIDFSNNLENIINVRDHSVNPENKEPLVEFITYAIMPNHYHFLVKQLVDDGITKFMQKFGTAYAGYFNSKYKRSGSLFQGKFKSTHVDSNEYLLYVSAYINLNDKVKINSTGKAYGEEFIFTGWESYIRDEKSEIRELIPCEKSIILDQFKNKREYEKFALSVLESVRENKFLQGELKQDGLI